MSAQAGTAGSIDGGTYSRRDLARVLRGLGFDVSPDGLDAAARKLREIASGGGAITPRTLRLIGDSAGMGRAN